MSDTALAFSSISELGASLRARTVSSVELAKFFLARLERLGPTLNSIVTLLHDRALAEAATADSELAAGKDRGPLHGIPYGVKDLIAARGGPTTWGAAPFKHQTFDYDATVVTRLHGAGAVLLGKLAMIELAGGMGYNQADASFTGPCKTPWNLECWSGGSSSGSGSSVSAGLVPFAIGSETDGSITNPSSYCGVTGLRPTYGRISRHGAMALSWTMDKLGPLCRNAADAELIFAAIRGQDSNDPTSLPEDAAVKTAMMAVHKNVRYATVKGAADKVQPEVRKNYHAALAALTGGASVKEVTLPKFPYDDMVGVIIAAEGGAAFREIISDGRVQTLASPEGRRGGYSYFTAAAVDYVDAMRLRAPMRRAFAKIFEEVDVLVSPTFSTVAPPISMTFDKVYPGFTDGPLITACNLVGIPAVAVPSGLGLHGMPTSVMFVGPALGESVVLQAAKDLQRQTDWHQKHPPMALV
ncbi:MAG TPA: amidase [Candidatus Eremiobacteraceae bacterium]|nr:amidase [Candidatus Eremiobacteraceae bacterium]